MSAFCNVIDTLKGRVFFDITKSFIITDSIDISDSTIYPKTTLVSDLKNIYVENGISLPNPTNFVFDYNCG